MTLPYTRQPDALRPSMFKAFETDPLGAYLRYLGPEDFKPPYRQSIPAASGTVFHAYAESAIKGEPLTYDLDPLTAEEKHAAEAQGRLMWWQYRCSGAFDLLNSIGIEEVEYEIPEDTFIPSTDIPLGGRVDVLARGKVVTDFKTSGTTKVGTARPHKGYALSLNGIDRPRCEVEVAGNFQHQAYGCPLEEINKQWADQFAMYSWGVGWTSFNPIRVCVHQIVYGVGVYVFDAMISTEHQVDLVERCKVVWDAIQEERVVPPGIAAGGIQRVRECA